MPFTPSHAVVALPFIRTPLVPAAIAVGAMTPDLPLFVRGLPLHYGRTHDFAWIAATLVLALVLLLVWRSVLRPAVRELSPAWLAVRLPEEWDRSALPAARETLAVRAVSEDGSSPRWRVSWSGVLLLLASLLLGIASHILWDPFTHEGRWGVSVLPALDEQWGPLLGYKWLQHGSSFLGLAIIGVWAIVWLVRADAAASVARLLPDAARWAWWLSLPVALVIAWVAGLAASGPLDDDFTVAHLAYRVLPPACAIWGAATLALCVAVQALRSSRRSRATVS
ncbi:DUF4184 family protein [Microbacterium sp. CFBP9034]|uniref:DUF4184 family protein n=1 Tax=Microbacterium sp. CFBP9034 TaxID=3096540 RepID=UPI002A6A3AB1|nr:DUF4184 family protein [Microbacterium sp. CFBP9034]MDY0909293.1 DUF4184 family protein [Microbacterium sp. CFBP9034]